MANGRTRLAQAKNRDCLQGDNNVPSVGDRIRNALYTEPKKYQIQAVRFLEATNGRGILGDDMGLGKTYEAMAWAAINPKARPIIVVCPSNVKYQWQEEFRKHAGMKSEVMEGRKPHAPKRDIVIINYTILATCRRATTTKPQNYPWVELLRWMKPKLIILDEFHYIKNKTAQRTKAVKKLCQKIPHVIGCSGTPIEKSPVEFFNILQLVNRKEFSNFWNYAMQYCDPKRGYQGRGWDFSGATNLEELHKRTAWNQATGKGCMIRRMKVDVAKELPPKIRVSIPVRIDNRRDYNQVEADIIAWFRRKYGDNAALSAMGAPALVKLGELKRVAAEGKVAAIHSWAQDFLNQSGEKLIIFCIHRKILDALQNLFPHCARICGKVKSILRPTEVSRFRHDKRCRVFLGQLKSAGVGLDGLHHASSTVLFAELGWNFSEMEQAEDRALRIGQTASSVNIYYTIAKNTIEEKVMEILQSKRFICNQVLNGNTTVAKLFERNGRD